MSDGVETSVLFAMPLTMDSCLLVFEEVPHHLLNWQSNNTTAFAELNFDLQDHLICFEYCSLSVWRVQPLPEPAFCVGNWDIDLIWTISVA